MEVNIMSKTALVKKFIKLNIKAGDSVYIESQTTPFSFSKVYTSFFLKTLIEYLGEEGTIVSNLNYLEKKIMVKDDCQESILVNTFETSMFSNYLSSLKDACISKSSFYPYVAIGKYAKVITASQTFDFPNGSNSPLARLYELHAKVILIDHNVKDMLVHKYCVESHPSSIINVTNGIYQADLVRYLSKANPVSLFDTMFKEKKYKKMFYYTKDNSNTILSFELRAYVDYCNSVFERRK